MPVIHIAVHIAQPDPADVLSPCWLRHLCHIRTLHRVTEPLRDACCGATNCKLQRRRASRIAPGTDPLLTFSRVLPQMYYYSTGPPPSISQTWGQGVAAWYNEIAQYNYANPGMLAAQAAMLRVIRARGVPGCKPSADCMLSSQ